MARHFNRRLLLCTLLGLGALAFAVGTVSAQEAVRWSQHVPGDSKPIMLDADEVGTWVEGEQRVVLLHGKVLLEHGTVHLRADEATVWIDQGAKRRTGVYQLRVVVFGAVQLDKGLETLSSDKATLELSTRGEVRLKSHTSRVVQQALMGDKLYLRARAELGLAPPAPRPSPKVVPASGIQRTGGVTPASGVVPAGGAVVVPQQGSPPAVTPAPAPPNPAPVAKPPFSQTQLTPPSSQSGSAGAPPGVPLPAAPPAAPPSIPTPAPEPAVVPPLPGGPPSVPGPDEALPGPRPLVPFTLRPRSSGKYQTNTITLPTGDKAEVFIGGIILTVEDPRIGVLDLEADRLVIWHKANAGQSIQQASGPPATPGQNSREVEFYLSGNVELRQLHVEKRSGRPTPVARTLRCDELYYDINRNVAVALRADLEFRQPGVSEPIHLKAQEFLQLSPTQFQGSQAEFYSSRLPSDPGLIVYVRDVNYEEKRVPRRGLFGQQVVDRGTGEPEMVSEALLRGTNVFVNLDNVPVLYLPFIQGDPRDPLGPLESITTGFDRIFGLQFKTSWNLYNLLGLDPLPGTRWRGYLDYLAYRGPAAGTDFEYVEPELFGVTGKHVGLLRAYGVNDTGRENLGSPPGLRYEVPHPDWRGRLTWRHNAQDLPDGFTVQAQISALSDKNFLEQYFKNEFDSDVNQETFLYVKQQRDNAAWTALAEPNLRRWVTETEWLPRADGYLLGQSFFNVFSYSAHGSVGYAQLRPTRQPPPPFELTDQRVDTGRFDLIQELSAPVSVYDLRLVPYGVVDLTEYTRDLTGESRGRLYTGGGVRGSLPFTRLYPNIDSLLFNLDGINHKIILSSNYYIAHSDTPFTRLPQLDRLHDDASDQAIRDITPFQTQLNPHHGLFLATLPQFDPQTYALRRLVDSRVDTLDTMEVFQFDLLQRWQTKRGYTGHQHIIDWMVLDLGASLYPHPGRDDFGNSVGILHYEWLWNIGDRTAITSSGWMDPGQQSARVWDIGFYFNRPDRTNFFVGYRQIYPLESQAVTASVSYVFSPKYAMTLSGSYDFGIDKNMSSSVYLSRIGTDLQANLGISYNAMQQNFGVTFELIPIVAINPARPGTSRFNSALLANH